MIRLVLEIDWPWTAGSTDLDERRRLHRARADLLRRFVERTGLVVRHWGETLGDEPREAVTVQAEARTHDQVRTVVEAALEWLQTGVARGVRIGIDGARPVSATELRPPRDLEAVGEPSPAERAGPAAAPPPAAAPRPAPRMSPPAPVAPPPTMAPAPEMAPPPVAQPSAPAASVGATPSEEHDAVMPAERPSVARAAPPPARRSWRSWILGRDRGAAEAEPRATRRWDPSAPVTGGDRPSPGAAAPPHVAYGLLKAPAEVVALEPFDLEVGLARDPAAGVAGSALLLPPVEPAPYSVTVRIAAAGFTFPPDQPQRLSLEVSATTPYPVIGLQLIPKRPRGGAAERQITAEYSIGGERVGDAIRSIRVLRSADERTRPATDMVESGVNVIAPTGPEAADLTLTVRTADTPGMLEWTLESPHTDVVTPNAVPIPVEVGEPGAFLRDSIQQIDSAEGSEGVFSDVLALGHRVRQRIPAGVWQAIRAVALKRGEPPTILLVSEEPFIPWELAVVEPPLRPGTSLPPFLAAQARIGRWVQPVQHADGNTRPSPNPPRRKDVASLGVVWGSYARTSWENLAHAKKEAKELEKLYGATSIEPTNKAMYDLLRGIPPADLLHFAVHGRYNPQSPGAESGIILTDGKSLHANEIAARDLRTNPVVFLNACQLGAGQLELGAYSGVAAAFVEAGASAVIAPLWKIDDDLARQIALAFYKQAASGMALSEVLRLAREPFEDRYETRSATWMAYQLFGHPSFVVGGLQEGGSQP